jgi:hypothetical protein
MDNSDVQYIEVPSMWGDGKFTVRVGPIERQHESTFDCSLEEFERPAHNIMQSIRDQ